MNETMPTHSPSSATAAAEPSLQQYADGVFEMFGEVLVLAAEENNSLQPLCEQALAEIEHLRTTLQRALEPAKPTQQPDTVVQAIAQMREEFAAAQAQQQQQSQMLIDLVSRTVAAMGDLNQQVEACSREQAALREQICAMQTKPGGLNLHFFEQLAAAERDRSERMQQALCALSSDLRQTVATALPGQSLS